LTAALTALAMLAFAGNSILCRLALGAGLIDAASFTAVRAVSGALILALLALPRARPRAPTRSDWLSASMLFAYMACFSFAYLTLAAGTGALLLFGAVQLTMIGVALRRGERLGIVSWLGLVAAIGGLAWLVAPGLAAPEPIGAALMAAAGVAWGVYSLLGRTRANPMLRTAGNFALTALLAIALLIGYWITASARLSGSAAGIGLAVASGALTSGLGYVIWYAALQRLSATQAASVQLTVPVIAAVMGVMWLGESLSPRLVIAAVAILGGVGAIVGQRTEAARSATR